MPIEYKIITEMIICKIFRKHGLLTTFRSVAQFQIPEKEYSECVGNPCRFYYPESMRVLALKYPGCLLNFTLFIAWAFSKNLK